MPRTINFASSLPETIDAGDTWTSGPYLATQEFSGIGSRKISFGGTLSEGGTLSVQRYADAACNTKIGTPQTATLTAATPNSVLVTDDASWEAVVFSIDNTSGSNATPSNVAAVIG